MGPSKQKDKIMTDFKQPIANLPKVVLCNLLKEEHGELLNIENGEIRYRVLPSVNYEELYWVCREIILKGGNK